MNSQSLYSANNELNDHLLSLRARMERLTNRVVGAAPPSQHIEKTEVGYSDPASPSMCYLDELGSITSANRDLVRRIEGYLTWFEASFNMENEDGKVAYTAAGTRL